MDYTEKIPKNPSLSEIPKAEKFSEAKLNDFDFDSWEEEIFVEEESKDEYPTMKGLTESMVEVFKILGMPQTLNPNFKAPSDYIGENFELTDSVKNILCSRRNYSQARLTRVYETFKRFYLMQKTLKQTKTDINIYFCDFILFSQKNGYDLDDYFDFEFYNKPVEAQNTFIGASHRLKNLYLGNAPYAISYVSVKETTNRIFKDFIHRDWINPRTASLEEFKLFVGKHPIFFAKKNVGCGGIGAIIIRTDENSNIAEIHSNLSKSGKIVEEIISQHESMKSFCPDTLNTIRMTTFLDVHGVVHILTAAGRFGRMGSVVDNYHSGGFSVVIDPKTGIIISDGLNRNHERKEFHPDTGKKFKGFQYPFWQEIRSTVIKMAKIVPAIRHVGWDIAINADGKVDLVEANEEPASDVQQAADSIGRLHLYAPLIEELENYWSKYFDLFGYRVNNLRSFDSSYESAQESRTARIPVAMKNLIPDCKSLMDLGCRKSPHPTRKMLNIIPLIMKSMTKKLLFVISTRANFRI